MRRFGTIAALTLLWLILCVLFLTGCHAYAPSGLLPSLGGALEEATDYSFFESLFLFVSTDYGEFCAILACFMATHLILLLQRYLLPWLQTHAPRLSAALQAASRRVLATLKRLLKTKTTPEHAPLCDQLEQLIEEAEQAQGDTAADEPSEPTDTASDEADAPTDQHPQ